MKRQPQRLVDILLILVLVVGLLLTAVAVSGGGLDMSFGGVRISSRTATRPATIAAAALLLWMAAGKRRDRQLEHVLAQTRARSTVIAGCLVLMCLAAAFRFGTFEASAADQYGYVSQARLWANGTLTIDQPLARDVPWPHPDETFSPLGYQPGLTRGTIVPTYPPGFPLTMAVLFKLVGPIGIYLVVPLLGMLAIWLTFLLGRQLAGPTCGLLAGALLLTSPAFLFHLSEPMSDVPVTAWWLVAIWFAVRRGDAWNQLFSGLAASAAIVTRPNLVPLVIPIGVWTWINFESDRGKRFLLLLMGSVPGCLVVARLNDTLYGSPFATGYGTVGAIFSTQHFWTNLVRYLKWLGETETPIIFFAMLAPWIISDTHRASRRLGWFLLGVSAVVFVCYLFYLSFDSWTYVRFLLPAIPLLLIVATAAILVGRMALSFPSRDVWLAALCCVLLAWRWDVAAAHGVQLARAADRRFAAVGLYVRDALPKNAVMISMIHAGSVRLYSSRLSLRWDLLDPEWLDRSVEFLEQHGYRPYLLLDETERSAFQQRFAPHSPLGMLDWPPVARYDQASRASIYDLADRGGISSVRTTSIPPVTGSRLYLAKLSAQ